jgi:hypothetical protein
LTIVAFTTHSSNNQSSNIWSSSFAYSDAFFSDTCLAGPFADALGGGLSEMAPPTVEVCCNSTIIEVSDDVNNY